VRAHPAAVELRQQQMTLARIIVALRVPLGEQQDAGPVRVQRRSISWRLRECGVRRRDAVSTECPLSERRPAGNPRPGPPDRQPLAPQTTLSHLG
jgi:hypothetical protein